MDRAAWWATVHGVTRIIHDLMTTPRLPVPAFAQNNAMSVFIQSFWKGFFSICHWKESIERIKVLKSDKCRFKTMFCCIFALFLIYKIYEFPLSYWRLRCLRSRGLNDIIYEKYLTLCLTHDKHSVIIFGYCWHSKRVFRAPNGVTSHFIHLFFYVTVVLNAL